MSPPLQSRWHSASSSRACPTRCRVSCSGSVSSSSTTRPAGLQRNRSKPRHRRQGQPPARHHDRCVRARRTPRRAGAEARRSLRRGRVLCLRPPRRMGCSPQPAVILHRRLVLGPRRRRPRHRHPARSAQQARASATPTAEVSSEARRSPPVRSSHRTVVGRSCDGPPVPVRLRSPASALVAPSKAPVPVILPVATSCYPTQPPKRRRQRSPTARRHRQRRTVRRPRLVELDHSLDRRPVLPDRLRPLVPADRPGHMATFVHRHGRQSLRAHLRRDPQHGSRRTHHHPGVRLQSDRRRLCRERRVDRRPPRRPPRPSRGPGRRHPDRGPFRRRLHRRLPDRDGL